MFVSPKPLKQAQAEFAALCQSLADQAWTRYMRCPSVRLYLVGSKSAGLDTHNPRSEIWSSLAVMSDDGLQTVRPEPLPRNVTRERMADVIRDWLRTEPLWIFAD